MLRSAEALEKAGRLAEAEAAYLRVLARWPDLPDTWYNLARLQRQAGRFDAALASYQQALDRGVSQPEEVHLNRGVIYSDCLRQDEAAERELHAALALNPDYVPALLNLANLREDFGKQAEARALYEKILALQPRYSIALARYAGLQKVARPDDPLIARLRAAIADSECVGCRSRRSRFRARQGAGFMRCLGRSVCGVHRGESRTAGKAPRPALASTTVARTSG